MEKYSICEKLCSLRTGRGLTQEAFAAGIGVSNKTVSKWENGTTEPDITSLRAIAEFYGVSLDYIFGLKDSELDTLQTLRGEFNGLTKEESFLKAFEICEAIVPASFQNMSGDGEPETMRVIPEPGHRMHVSSDHFYTSTVKTDEINMSVTLLRNKANFEWLRDREVQDKLWRLFNFLCNPSVLRMISFIHSTACPCNFTAEYMAKLSGTCGGNTEEVASLLDEACELELISKRCAHMRYGDVTVYEAYGNGNILVLLSLAHDVFANNKCFSHSIGGTCKMIEGGREK